MNLGAAGFENKRTRNRKFLDGIKLVVSWSELVSLIAPHTTKPGAEGGRPPFAVETLRLHFGQQWFNLSDQGMVKELNDTPMFREFADIDAGEDHLPNESTILRFRHLLGAKNLSVQTLTMVQRHADCSAQLYRERHGHV